MHFNVYMIHYYVYNVLHMCALMYYYAILLGYVSFSENMRKITRKKKREEKY